MKKICLMLILLLPLLLYCNSDKPDIDIVISDKDYVYVDNGKLYEPDGSELKMWGVNLQPNLSWEYNDRLKKRGIALTADALKEVTDNNLDEVERLGVNVIRCHLTPADFTDGDGNIVETVYLDVLDYMIAEASKRNIYVVLALINHMGYSYVQDSMWSYLERQEWIHNKEAIRKSKEYFRQIMTRVNKYSGETYSKTLNIAMWELINEPATYNYWEVQNTSYYKDFRVWAVANTKLDNEDFYYTYSVELIRNYIDEMYDVLRESGAKQPIVWGLNWHNHRKWNPWAFDAAIASKVEVVAFCNYPGQDLLPSDYWAHPEDLTDADFSDWFKTNYDNLDGYGWARSEKFAQKAKISYEFETFYNLSAYLYPVQALYFKSLGVQSATMWTYTLKEVAEYFNASHFLNLTCTPQKAASFIIAKEIFFDTPLYTPFDTSNPNEQVGANYAISKSRNLSIFSTTDKLYYSGDITAWNPLPVNNTVKSIVGYGSSPLVTYNGTGIYFIDEKDGELVVTLEPNSTWIREPWKSGNLTVKVTELDYDTKNEISIMLANWTTGKHTVYKIDGATRDKLFITDGLQKLLLSAGSYVIIKGEH